MNSNMAYAIEAMSERPDPRYENERYLLKIIKEQLGVTDEDMRDTSKVKAKVRAANLDKVVND